MNQHLYIDDRGRSSARVREVVGFDPGQSSGFKNYRFPALPLLLVLKRRIRIFRILSSETEKSED
jgi:hypothetical protein